MKKLSMVLLSFLLIFAMVGCGNKDEETTNDTSSNEKDTATAEIEETVQPTEPTADSVCAGCEMKIYMKDEEMGQFTAQAVSESGEHLFFDDSGCLLNYARKNEEKYQTSWVRNYYTLDWIVANDALAVHSDIITPMKMGNAFFSIQDEIDQFISENADLNPEVVTWDDIDEVAYERYLKKQQSQNNNQDSSTNDEETGMDM